jgi:hypothetical protein
MSKRSKSGKLPSVSESCSEKTESDLDTDRAGEE